MDKNDEKLVKFTKAIDESIEWVLTHSANEVALSIKEFFKETSVEILTNAVQRYKDIAAWSMNPYLSENEFKHLQNIIISSGELDKYMPYNTLVQNKFDIGKR